MSSVVRWYKLSEDTANLGEDSSTNQKDLTNFGVTSVTDSTYGKVAYFNGSSYLRLASSDIPTNMLARNSRTMSFWMKPEGNSIYEGLVTYGNSVSNGSVARRYAVTYNAGSDLIMVLFFNLGATQNGPNTITSNEWHHVTVVLHDTGNLSQIYIDGNLSVSGVKDINTALGYDLYVGWYQEAGDHFVGCMTDMRFYDGALDSASIISLYNDGPVGNPSLIATAYTHIIDIDWPEITGASTYTLRYTVDSAEEQDLVTTTGLSHVFYNVIPGSSYELRLYTDLDTNTPYFTEIVVTLLVDNANTLSLLTRLGNDLTLLNSVSIDDISESIPQVLSTGDVVNTSIGNTTFVEDAGIITLSDTNDHILTPFDASLGPGQRVSIVLPDTSTKVVTFDESTEQVVIDSISYSVGDHLVLGGLKAIVKDI